MLRPREQGLCRRSGAEDLGNTLTAGLLTTFLFLNEVWQAWVFKVSLLTAVSTMPILAQGIDPNSVSGVTCMAGTQNAMHTERYVLSPAAFMDFRCEVSRRLYGGATTQARLLWGSVVEIRHAGSLAGAILGGFPSYQFCAGVLAQWLVATDVPSSVVGSNSPGWGCGADKEWSPRQEPPRLKLGQDTTPAMCGFLRMSCRFWHRWTASRPVGAPSGQAG